MSNAFVVHGQRVDHTMCAKCRKPFSPGNRVGMAMIVENPDAINPGTMQRAAQMSAEFEMVHVDCRDPFLNGIIST